MNVLPSTRSSLLAALSERCNESWQQFDAIYGSAILGYARRRGLQFEDASDLKQEVLSAVAKQISKFEPGSFRGWLFGITRRKLLNFWRRQQRHKFVDGSTETLGNIEEFPDHVDETIWDEEYERSVFSWAAEKVRSQFQARTWQAFWETMVEGKSTADTASKLEMSEGAVRIARCRVLARIKALIERGERTT